jgi:hypothetical protein
LLSFRSRGGSQVHHVHLASLRLSQFRRDLGLSLAPLPLNAAGQQQEMQGSSGHDWPPGGPLDLGQRGNRTDATGPAPALPPVAGDVAKA